MSQAGGWRRHGTEPSSRPHRGVLLVAFMLVFATGLLNPGGAAVAASPYRVHHFQLADICTDGLPWTAEPTPAFPPPWPHDKHGVPMIKVKGKLYYRPGALAINGMKRLDAYRDSGDERQLAFALKEAKRLRLMSLSRRHAHWVPFQYDYPDAGQRAPWFNAMAQGLVLSFYVRLYLVTGDELHLTGAGRIFKSFLRLGQRRPTWVAYVDAKRYLWLEHYPLRRPDHVLNAHLHAIFGIYEYWQVTRSATARRVLEGAVTTMRDNAYRYRRKGSWSYYGLRVKSVVAKYHSIHIWQLRLLAKISGDAYFSRLASKLARDVRPKPVPGRPADRRRSIVSPACRPSLPTP